MIKIKPTEIVPKIRICNYIKVQEGMSWGWRKIPDYELILFVKGHFLYEDEFNSEHLNKGHILAISPLVDHRLSLVDKEGVISCIHFDLIAKEDGGTLLYSPLPYPELVTKPNDYNFYHQAFKECSNLFSGVSTNRTLLLTYLFSTIWLKLNDNWKSQKEISVSLKMEKIISYIREHLFDNIDRNEIARAFNYTPEYINQLFKNNLQITPTQFINREKVLIGFNMLQNEGASVKEVAFKLGFCDQYHFSRVFKKIIGMNPSHFKQK